jgi:hypothetical protein
MSTSVRALLRDVLVVGATSVGAEIAKNLALSHVWIDILVHFDPPLNCIITINAHLIITSIVLLTITIVWLLD